MTYYDLMLSANRKLENGDITLGEYEEMIAPLKREIEPERKPCYWTHDKDGWECGACHSTIRDDDFPTCMGAPIYNYCPLCGEDMRGVQDDKNRI